MTGSITADAAGTGMLGDRVVNRLGLGAMRLTGTGVFGRGTPSDRGRSLSVLRRAIDLGVNHLDTAAFYFSSLRSANEPINQALAPYPDDLVITTKVGPGRDPSGQWLPWATPEQLRGQVEENFRQLGRDHLDVVNLRVHGRRVRGAGRRVRRVLRDRRAGPGGRCHRRGQRRRPRGRPRPRGECRAGPSRLNLRRGPHVLAIPGTGDPDQ